MLYYLLGIILIPGIILAVYAQTKVSTAYSAFSKIKSVNGKTAEQVAREILDKEKLSDVKIERVAGNLTDYYNPKTKTLYLSSGVYGSSSIAALGIAAHEAGHAIQHAKNYGLLKLRNSLGKVANIANTLMWPILIVGFVLDAFAYSSVGLGFMIAGLVIYGLIFLFSLVTLPVEINASKRAEVLLLQTQSLNEVETRGAKKVLKAAALTYVAALIMSILYVLRFVIFIFLSRD